MAYVPKYEEELKTAVASVNRAFLQRYNHLFG